jgi:cell division transport system permease protein
MVLSAINKQVDILVEVKDSADKATVDEFLGDLKNQKQVNQAMYMSKEEVFESFSKAFTNIKEFWEKNNLSNPLPAMVRIEITNPTYRQAVIDFVSSKKYEQVINKDFFAADLESYKAKQIVKITEATKKFILALTVLFFLLSVIIIFNTIRINIFSRREELQIMQVVGAKYYYLRMPFVIEGALYGVLGAMITALVMIVVVVLISPAITQYLSGYQVGFEYSFYKYLFPYTETTFLKFYVANFFNFLGFLILNGIVIGGISASVATYKYEKL